MPLFEYHCRTCSRRFEALVMGASHPACPGCAGRDLKKLVSTFAVGNRGGGSLEGAEPVAEGGGCGTCGDPRGPGSCASE
jgi:putative FmdB family regulatory protein